MTKSFFSNMLNQKPVTAPRLEAPSVKVQRPIGTPTFAYLGNEIKRPMIDEGADISKGIWARALAKPKGVKHG